MHSKYFHPGREYQEGDACRRNAVHAKFSALSSRAHHSAIIRVQIRDKPGCRTVRESSLYCGPTRANPRRLKTTIKKPAALARCLKGPSWGHLLACSTFWKVPGKRDITETATMGNPRKSYVFELCIVLIVFVVCWDKQMCFSWGKRALHPVFFFLNCYY